MDAGTVTTAQLLDAAGWKLARASTVAPWAAVWIDPVAPGAEWLQYAALTEEMGRRDRRAAGIADPAPASTAPEPATPDPTPDSEDLF